MRKGSENARRRGKKKGLGWVVVGRATTTISFVEEQEVNKAGGGSSAGSLSPERELKGNLREIARIVSFSLCSETKGFASGERERVNKDKGQGLIVCAGIDKRCEQDAGGKEKKKKKVKRDEGSTR